MRFNARLIAACLIAACGSSSMTTTPPPPPPPPGPPPPPPTQHLYFGLDDEPGYLYSYALPITANSQPVATVRLDAVMSVGVSSTTLAAATLNDSLFLYSLPLTSSSVPYARIASGSFGTPLFLSSGQMYQGGVDTINVYAPPFASGAVPASRIPTPTLSPTHLALAPDGKVYESLGTINTIGVISGNALATKLTAAPGIAFHGMAANATQLFVCESEGSASHIFIYTLPLTATATPSTIMNPNTFNPDDCALDSSGNLYVAAGTVIEYNPPFTTVNPFPRAVTLALPIGGTVRGIAIGP